MEYLRPRRQSSCSLYVSVCGGILQEVHMGSSGVVFQFQHPTSRSGRLDDICVVQELSTVTSYTFLFPTRLCYYSHTAGSSPSPEVQFRVFIFGQANAGPSGHPIDYWHARRKLVLCCTLSAKWMSSQKHTFCRVCVIQRAAQVC